MTQFWIRFLWYLQYTIFCSISPFFPVCLPVHPFFLSLCLSRHYSASSCPLFLSWLLYYFLNVAFTQWQLPPTSRKGVFFFFFFPLLSFLARLLLLYGMAVCLLLQCCFTGPAGVARVRQPRPGTRWFHDSGAPCLANLPAAGVQGLAWLILSLSLSTRASRAVYVARPGWVSQTYTEVCALTFTLMETEAMQDWGGKGNVE